MAAVSKLSVTQRVRQATSASCSCPRDRREKVIGLRGGGSRGVEDRGALSRVFSRELRMRPLRGVVMEKCSCAHLLSVALLPGVALLSTAAAVNRHPLTASALVCSSSLRSSVQAAY